MNTLTTEHENTNIPERITKSISMISFVLHFRGMTTSELCKTYPNTFKYPVWNGNQNDMVKDILAIDAILWKLVGEYAKFNSKIVKKGFYLPCDNDDNLLEKPVADNENWTQEKNR